MQAYNFKELPAQQTNLALLLSYTWLLRNLSMTIGLCLATIYFRLNLLQALLSKRWSPAHLVTPATCWTAVRFPS